MRIRYPFAGAFAFVLLLSGYIGLLPHSPTPSTLQPNDKLLHLLSFFLLSLTFYWVLDTSRRRTLHLTIIICTMILGIGSELLQALLPNDRSFDPFDVLANIVGSLSAVGLCTWYHKRMLERKRKARFGALLGGHEGSEDVELGISTGDVIGARDDDEEDGEGQRAVGLGPQESGVISLEQEVDNWDENAVDDEDWDAPPRTAAAAVDEDGQTTGTSGDGDGEGQKTPASSSAGNIEDMDVTEIRKKRTD
ncbi:hypothetical protein AJ80_03976 [Polytolypa hystricis UAMH7299]|uniref:VanZ-like domain-containing protein n=1 Tax=Polytolypa hystricis (strain UAMH7299) TaxID=1447883 RepID=A0A2B7YCT3_POLH7|nr:hypothetical protein AJ80_03976 [Polytolypa hystricis UAMH7299]